MTKLHLIDKEARRVAALTITAIRAGLRDRKQSAAWPRVMLRLDDTTAGQAAQARLMGMDDDAKVLDDVNSAAFDAWAYEVKA